jgi:hypothetical protein
MMQAKTMEEVLALWREGERLLDTVEPGSTDHDAVVLAVERMRELYSDLGQAADISPQVAARARETIDDARALIDNVARPNRVAKRVPHKGHDGAP